MKKVVFVLFIGIFGMGLFAQSGESDFGIKFSGFVKNDFIFDSRQTVSAREGHFLLWPAAELPDFDDKDINAKANFNFLAIQTRLKGTISGPDVLGAKTSAVIEGAFFGHSNSDVNGFRLRHAFGKLNWKNTELLFGQYWHPMFITGCFPGVVSFNTGSPFQPFARNPQLRITYKTGDLGLMVAAISQRDFTSPGGSSQLRNSMMPETHFQVFYNPKNSEAGTEFLAGLGAGYKMVVPRLQTDSGYVAHDKFGSIMAQGFIKIRIPKVTIKLEGTYGQNNYDVLMLSSWGVTSVDTITDHREYTLLSSMSFWAEIHTNGKTWQAGLFAGYTKNLGAKEEILPEYVFGERSDIDYVYRVAPRIIYNVGKLRFALELEYTTAAFGGINVNGTIDDAIPVSNLRTLIGAYYFF
jgi:hypothetical protein